MSRHVVLLRRDPSLGLALRALLHGTGRVTELQNVQDWSAMPAEGIDAVVIDLPSSRRKQAIDLVRSRFDGRLVLVLDPHDDPAAAPTHHAYSLMRRPFEIVELWHLVTTDPSGGRTRSRAAEPVGQMGPGVTDAPEGPGFPEGPKTVEMERPSVGPSTAAAARGTARSQEGGEPAGRMPEGGEAPAGAGTAGGGAPGAGARRRLDLEVARPPLRTGDRHPARPGRGRAGERRATGIPHRRTGPAHGRAGRPAGPGGGSPAPVREPPLGRAPAPFGRAPAHAPIIPGPHPPSPPRHRGLQGGRVTAPCPGTRPGRRRDRHRSSPTVRPSRDTGALRAC
jgi:hypothetical protein